MPTSPPPTATRPKSLASAGTRLKMAELGQTNFTRIAGVRDFSEGPQRNVDEFETTEVDAMIDDAANKPDWGKYFEPGKEDYGQVVARCSFDVENLQKVEACMDERKKMSFQLVYSDGSYHAFDGWFKTFQLIPNSKEDVLFDITIRLISKAVYVGGNATPPVAPVTP